MWALLVLCCGRRPRGAHTLALNTNKIFPVGRSGVFLLVKASKRSQGLCCGHAHKPTIPVPLTAGTCRNFLWLHFYVGREYLQVCGHTSIEPTYSFVDKKNKNAEN